MLVTSFEYGYGGSGDELYPGQDQDIGTTWVKATDPSSTETYTFSDNLGRRIRVIRNYAAGGAPASYDDPQRGITVQRNVTSSFEYDAAGRLIRAVAHEYAAGGSVELQVTKYDYGVSPSDDLGPSDIESNALLRSISYGKDAGGVGGEVFSRRETFGYNQAGQPIFPV